MIQKCTAKKKCDEITPDPLLRVSCLEFCYEFEFRMLCPSFLSGSRPCGCHHYGNFAGHDMQRTCGLHVAYVAEENRATSPPGCVDGPWLDLQSQIRPLPGHTPTQKKNQKGLNYWLSGAYLVLLLGGGCMAGGNIGLDRDLPAEPPKSSTACATQSPGQPPDEEQRPTRSAQL